jgi:AcrR family transcriptional regulator
MPNSRRAAGDVRGASSSPVPADTAAPSHPHLNAILDAAEAVVLRDGMGKLTLDAVAKQARLSKAGLLHHVPSKDELISAMVRRQTAQWFDEFMHTYAQLAAGGHSRPAIGTMMSTCLSGTHAWTDAERARNRVMVAALVHDERQVEPLREVHRRITSLIRKDDLPPGVGETIHLAVHGLWFQWIFGMDDISAARLKAIRGALADVAGMSLPSPPSKDIKHPGAKSPNAKAPKPTRAMPRRTTA